MSNKEDKITMNDQHMGKEKEQEARMKSAIVLYDLERTLGNFVCAEKKDPKELPDWILKRIEEREMEAGRSFDGSTTAGVIAATYLTEVLRLAEDAAKKRPAEEHIKRLSNLFEMLDVFDIRNAISHPNRPFHPSYWYRVAALATDPLMDKLQFTEVAQAFRKAEMGALVPPPENWMKGYIWFLPNNLPQQFDHGITGLIGRKQELGELKTAMKNERLNFIALVAPGGWGKTALLLEALNDTAHSPESVEWVERILYFSSKTEVLTAEGVVTQIPIAADMEGIRRCIALTLAEQEEIDEIDEITFDAVCKKLGNQRILLCLDNLETILRDEPDAFHEFYLTLPREWRVIVTSRIDVNGATTIPLPPLSEEGALDLARNYSLKRGHGGLSKDELKNIVQTCNSNPLAIRLAIDGAIAGKPPISSATVARDKVLEFSYTNLIDALSPVAQEVLECLFAMPKPINRAKACVLLERNIDEIAEAFRQLGGTSLLTRTRSQSEELYTLSSSVRDLLLRHPINEKVRESVDKKRQTTKVYVFEIDKEQRDTSPLAKNYIPDSVPEELRVIAVNALREESRSSHARTRLLDHLDNLNQAIDIHKDQAFLHRIRGLILLKLKDRVRGKIALEQACKMEDIASRLLLSGELRKDRDYREAAEVAEPLVKDGWDDPKRSIPSLARLVVKNYYISLMLPGETDKIDKVIQETKNWKQKDLRGTFGSLQAQALRESVNRERNLEKTEKGLCAAVDVLDEVFDLEGYFGVAALEGMKLVKQLANVTKNDLALSQETKSKFIRFVDKHLEMMCQVHKTYSLEDDKVKEWVRILDGLRKNEIASEQVEAVDAIASEEEISAESWIPAIVKTRPQENKRTYRPFLFAESREGENYYVHRDKLECAEQFWETIQIGDCLEVLPGPKGDKARPVRRARPADKIRWEETSN